ncbi:ABC transporter ATP-binding protein [Corynebacterium macginleyi]|uniref:ABC transporter ATP-binding protein n=1 Tax=Corynebacterium macginleyi TaxID=38290 RepID=UPI00190A0088|nr:ABC transporter ATP-binding protein [Corynebacterium macginleyi]MBK4163615.1 ATP-binding cassette domain-containing protein [Corynebacterium macginleyi]
MNEHRVATSVNAHEVSFTYPLGARPGIPGVSNVSFCVSPGQCLLITGDSGSGKSTILKLINGLIPHFNPEELLGTITIRKNDQTFTPAQEPLSRAIEFSASVFQNPRTQFFTESVNAELAFGLENLGIDPAEIESRIQSAVDLLGIRDLRGRRLKELSGGQLQTVACACALVFPGSLVLLDEPTSNLSMDSIEMLACMLRRLKELGTTIIIADHRLFFLKGIADQVIYLNQGKISRSFHAHEFYALDETARKQLGLRSLHHVPLPASVPTSPTQENTDPQQSGLELSRVRFSYGTHEVINIDHAYFPKGEVTALIGPNGVGKTTLARIICGLASPKRGGILRLNGKRIRAATRRRSAYMVMQDVGRQLFAATTEEEVTLGLAKSEREHCNVNEILHRLDLEDVALRHPQSLSGGQRQRLAIASAQAEQAEVYIFDEPTSGVGWHQLQSISTLLQSLAASGAVVIVITHDHEFIQESVTRIIDMTEINKN